MAVGAEPDEQARAETLASSTRLWRGDLTGTRGWPGAPPFLSRRLEWFCVSEILAETRSSTRHSHTQGHWGHVGVMFIYHCAARHFPQNSRALPLTQVCTN